MATMKKKELSGLGWRYNMPVGQYKRSKEQIERCRAMRKTFGGFDFKKYNKAQRGKSWEERFGKKRAKFLKMKHRRRFSGSGNNMYDVHLTGSKNPMYGRPAPNGSGRGKKGVRKDLGCYFRSTWEANYARYLNYRGIRFLYEPVRFKLGEYTYIPDFYLVDQNQFVELKGVIIKKNMFKYRLLQQMFPKIKTKLIGPRIYGKLHKKYRHKIKHWESTR